jgi:integrase
MQKGSLICQHRKHGPDVWQFRWSEYGLNGRRIYRKRVIGTAEHYPNSFARDAVSGLLLRVNSAVAGLKVKPLTIAQLCAHFEQHELARENSWRTFSTKKIYKAYLRRWVIPQWGGTELSDIKAIHVECWLRQLPLARSSCAKIRNLMSVLFNHACRYELFDQNPIRLVRQSASAASRLTSLLSRNSKVTASPSDQVTDCGAPCRIYRIASKRVVRSEMGDLDFAEGTMNVARSVVYGVPGPCKTEASQKPVPLHPLLADAPQKWRIHAAYKRPSDWIVASKRHRGRRPLWGQAILRRHVRPAAKRAGIERHFGWHTFRHTYSTLLRGIGTEFKVMQELLRHSTLRSTLDIYTQAMTPAKRAAQAAVLSLVFPEMQGKHCSNRN